MYIRVTILQCDPAHVAEVERLWREVSRPHARSQEGNIDARAFRSPDSPGQMIMIGEWETLEQADAYLRSPEHDELMAKYGPFVKAGLARYVGEIVE